MSLNLLIVNTTLHSLFHRQVQVNSISVYLTEINLNGLTQSVQRSAVEQMVIIPPQVEKLTIAVKKYGCMKQLLLKMSL